MCFLSGLLNISKKGFHVKTEKVRAKLTKHVEAMSKILAARAMEVTQNVNEKQCSERKKFLEFLKMSSSDFLQIQRKWRTIITNLTHDRSAIWRDGNHEVSVIK